MQIRDNRLLEEIQGSLQAKVDGAYQLDGHDVSDVATRLTPEFLELKAAQIKNIGRVEGLTRRQLATMWFFAAHLRWWNKKTAKNQYDRFHLFEYDSGRHAYDVSKPAVDAATRRDVVMGAHHEAKRAWVGLNYDEAIVLRLGIELLVKDPEVFGLLPSPSIREHNLMQLLYASAALAGERSWIEAESIPEVIEELKVHPNPHVKQMLKH